MPIDDIQELLQGENVIAENVSFEAYTQDFNDQNVEWLLGYVIKMPSKTVQHQRVLGTLFTLMGLFVDTRKLGDVILGPFTMYPGGQQPAREPDLLFVARKSRAQFRANYFAGAAELVVEVVDPESVRRDRVLKLREYEAAGVREYWLVDPIKTEFLVHVADTPGQFRLLPHDKDGKIVSRTLRGFTIRPDLLWRNTLPNGDELMTLVQSML